MVAILCREDDADRYTEALLGTHSSRMSAAGDLEAAIVIDRIGAVYRPSEAERAELTTGLEDAHVDPSSIRYWSDVRAQLKARR